MDFLVGELLTNNFDGPILYEPARKENGYNHLRIITAFTDCDRISTHMIGLADGIKSHEYVKDISVDIILGMTKSSLSQKKHQEICRLVDRLSSTRGMPKLSVSYVCEGAEVHSKVYIWSKDNDPSSIAYCGSLNYTMNAFYKRRESVVSCEATEAIKYYYKLMEDSIPCIDSDISSKLKNVVNNSIEDIESTKDETYEMYDRMIPIDTIKVSLLRADGSDTGYGSGINWGIRKNGTKRNQNQAYIPYNKADKKPGFFPDRINPEDSNCPIFKVITSDFGSFYMRMAQDGNKGIHSAESNAILGEWIRKRLHAPMGGYITKQMLENYGRTYVTFRKYSDGVYLLDF